MTTATMINWKYIIETVLVGMRQSAAEQLPTLDLFPGTELSEFRTFKFKAGRGNGKSHGIVEYTLANDWTAIYDATTKSLYARQLDQVKSGYKIISLKRDLTPMAAFLLVKELGVKTLFLDSHEDKTREHFASFYAAHGKNFPADFMLVIEE